MSEVSISKSFESVVSFPYPFQNIPKRPKFTADAEHWHWPTLFWKSSSLPPPGISQESGLLPHCLAPCPLLLISHSPQAWLPCRLALSLPTALPLFPVFTHSRTAYPFLHRQFAYVSVVAFHSVPVLYLPAHKQPKEGF